MFLFQDAIKSVLELKRTNEHQFEQVGQYWMGADYIKEEARWTWTHHYQDFNNWTNWQSNVPDIGIRKKGLVIHSTAADFQITTYRLFGRRMH